MLNVGDVVIHNGEFWRIDYVYRDGTLRLINTKSRSHGYTIYASRVHKDEVTQLEDAQWNLQQ